VGSAVALVTTESSRPSARSSGSASRSFSRLAISLERMIDGREATKTVGLPISTASASCASCVYCAFAYCDRWQHHPLGRT
jgi:hypothetical protein